MNRELYNLKNCNKRNRSRIIYRRDIARDILRNDNGKFRCINEVLFNKIIDRIFELKVKELYSNGYVNIGYGLGNITISLKKRKNDIKYYAVDWNKTLNLWLNNNKAKKDKKLVRVINYDKLVKFTWKKVNINKNMKYYKFITNRNLRKQLYFDVINNKNIMFYE